MILVPIINYYVNQIHIAIPICPPCFFMLGQGVKKYIIAILPLGGVKRVTWKKLVGAGDGLWRNIIKFFVGVKKMSLYKRNFFKGKKVKVIRGFLKGEIFTVNTSGLDWLNIKENPYLILGAGDVKIINGKQNAITGT